jgi:regulatory protein
MEKTEEYIKARSRAIKYIMYKMRTSLEVYNKLKELEFPENEINKVIEDLTQLEYINDEEYAKKFIASNIKTKKLSKSILRLKLKNKGISDEIIDKYLLELGASDIDAIIKILEKKNFLKTIDFDEKNNIKLYCMRKGFSISDINKAIKIFLEE